MPNPSLSLQPIICGVGRRWDYVSERKLLTQFCGASFRFFQEIFQSGCMTVFPDTGEWGFLHGSEGYKQQTSQMESIRVGYLGPPGTYSHQAALQEFAGLEKTYNVEYMPLRSIAGCFNAVQEGSVDYSLVPFENSSNGQVVFSYDLFRDWFMTEGEAVKPDFAVVDEVFVPIHHNLITFAKDVSEITKIYSHPQVWTQCRKFLAGFEAVEKQDTSSTSKAVEMVSRLQDDATLRGTEVPAAIASVTASHVHGVPVLVETVEDMTTNTTRFLCLGRQPVPAPEPLHPASRSPCDKVQLVTFTLRENERAGSLCEVLDLFKSHGISLLSITTRPCPSYKPWSYVFFVEALTDSDSDDQIQECVNDMCDLVGKVTTLGHFLRQR